MVVAATLAGVEEEQLRECRLLFSDLVLQPHVVDQWLWQYDPGGGYSVRGAYDLLTHREAPGAAVIIELLWHKQVPRKLSVLAWRLLRNRLPTRDNLVRRNIIAHDSQLCVSSCGGVESAHHLFLSCPVFASLWGLVRHWVGTSSTDPFKLHHNHFVQFVHSAGGNRARRSFMQLLWLSCTLVVWQERNSRIFKAKESTVLQMLEKVKVHSLWWMKPYNVNISLNYHTWWSTPPVCLGLG
jgi:hypothetical protein